ncbi:Uncharacterised protein (plasmid) [Legionella adelaidensis]|uniref:Uncharacterized protein n=1 Tax=Legionella adelaidensis TaxID=45056 RepID=A0A0W0R1F2_9GAMM|nr:hypothetical protein [Legionella adelaidensis]KTC64918.1 hypothetical protein Lade_1725 [Legionella adelaidensis]VEH85601.1 Uncharacterised protein [Legionella adelaidensis]
MRLLQPIFEQQENRYFTSTRHRFFSLAEPIQATKEKKSDFWAFLLTPAVDVFVLAPAYAIEASIHLLNASASLLRAAYLWTLNQQQSDSILDHDTKRELIDAWSSIKHALSGIIARMCNAALSIVGLIIRPFVSFLHFIFEDRPQQLTYERMQYPSAQAPVRHAGIYPPVYSQAPVEPTAPPAPQYDQVGYGQPYSYGFGGGYYG